jgi:photosystem II stability/assembly factor-like uncharacterized protein
MKKQFGLLLMAISLILAALACTPPWSPPPTDPAEVTPTETETPDSTTPDVPTPTKTATHTPEPAPDLPVVSNPTLAGLEMFSPDAGWALTRDRNQLLRTEDGGQTWLDATPPGLTSPPEGFTTLGIHPEFLDESLVWFTPNSEPPASLYHSLDGGASWSVLEVPFDNASYEFVDPDTGYALVSLGAGAGSHFYAIYRTLDGGETWTEVFSHEPGESKSLPEGGYKNGITFLDANHGWVGGGKPMPDFIYLYVTEDGGQTWTHETGISVDPMFEGFLFDVWQPHFVTDSVGYLPIRAMSPDGWSHTLIYKTGDSGQTWTYQNFSNNLRGLVFTSPETAWAVSKTALLRGTESGVVWFVPSMTGIPEGAFFLEIDFVDENHGWVLTTPSDETREPVRLYRTSDGGETWTSLTP